MNRIPIELVAPAKNLATGIAAIEHGADAVYIGGPSFGARSAAANSIDDIAQLVSYAHVYHAKVYVALNTILYENEITHAVDIAHKAYNVGADALIIQDLGLLECDLPPIPLHASTQLNNKTVEKVQFLENVGFSQVVLARELSLNQIKEIRAHTRIPLECFVHGAICVCYSGQCYMSAYTTGRSGNRGECSQMCRHAYTIEGLPQASQKQAYYLSPKDLELSSYVGAMIDAGVQSFKIEGRLKDETYVKNCTAWYRNIIDKEIAQRSHTYKASHGLHTFGFTPNIHKTFSRGFTNYYIQHTRNSVANIHSPKSQGEYIGTLKKLHGTKAEFNTNCTIHNGDGLCYIANSVLQGVRVNLVRGNEVELADTISCEIGTQFWRNYSSEFTKQVERSNECRTIEVHATFTETETGYGITLHDAYGTKAYIERMYEKNPARNSEKMKETIVQQIKKSGLSSITISNVEVDWKTPLFLPISEINEARRICVQRFIDERVRTYVRQEFVGTRNTIPYPHNEPHDARLNASNSFTQSFFERHGITPSPAFELQHDIHIPLMTTKYCIRYECGACIHQIPGSKASPIYLNDNRNTYRIEFDCKKCEMNIFFASDTK